MCKLKRLSNTEADVALASFNITKEQVEASFSQLDSLLGISSHPIAASGHQEINSDVNSGISEEEVIDG
jgi:hypothetical protein